MSDYDSDYENKGPVSTPTKVSRGLRAPAKIGGERSALVVEGKSPDVTGFLTERKRGKRDTGRGAGHSGPPHRSRGGGRPGAGRGAPRAPEDHNFIYISGSAALNERYSAGGTKPIVPMNILQMTDGQLVEHIKKKIAPQITGWFNCQTTISHGPITGLHEGMQCKRRIACMDHMCGKPHKKIDEHGRPVDLTHSFAECLLNYIIGEFLQPDTKESGMHDEATTGTETKHYWSYTPPTGYDVLAIPRCKTADGKNATGDELESDNKCIMTLVRFMTSRMIDFYTGYDVDGRVVRLTRNGDHTRPPPHGSPQCGVESRRGGNTDVSTFICLPSLMANNTKVCRYYHTDAQSIATELVMMMVKFQIAKKAPEPKAETKTDAEGFSSTTRRSRRTVPKKPAVAAVPAVTAVATVATVATTPVTNKFDALA